MSMQKRLAGTPQRLLMEYINLRAVFFKDYPETDGEISEADEERFKEYARSHASKALKEDARKHSLF